MCAITTQNRAVYPKPSPSQLNYQNLNQEIVNKLCAHYFTTIVNSNHERLQEASTNPASAVSKPGMWCANDYAKLLKDLKDTEITYNGISSTASKIYTMLKELGMFTTRMGSRSYWANVKDPSTICGLSLTEMELKKGVSPSAAFKSFFKEVCFVDCNVTYDIAEGLTLIELIGEEAFDNCIKALGTFRLGSNNPKFTPLRSYFYDHPIPLNITIDGPFDALEIGQFVYIQNHPLYTTKHLFGVSRGYNLIYLGDGKFTCFDLPPKGLTLREIALILLNEYNSQPIEADLVIPSKYVELFKPLSMENTEDCFLHAQEVQSLAEAAIGPIPAERIIPYHILKIANAFKNSRAVLKKPMSEEEFFAKTTFFPQEPIKKYFINLSTLRRKMAGVRIGLLEIEGRHAPFLKEHLLLE